jgi:hypothetical protein
VVVLENMKEVADLIKKVGDMELYRKIVASEGEVIELTREKRRLEDAVEELERTLAVQKRMEFRTPFDYQDADLIPFCPRCRESSRRAGHLFHKFTNEQDTRWDCLDCKNMYMVHHRRGCWRFGREKGDSKHGLGRARKML